MRQNKKMMFLVFKNMRENDKVQRNVTKIMRLEIKMKINMPYIFYHSSWFSMRILSTKLKRNQKSGRSCEIRDISFPSFSNDSYD